MSRRKEIGWCSKVVKVIALILIYCNGHLVTCVDGAGINAKSQQHDHVKGGARNPWPTPEEVVEDSVNPEIANGKKHNADSNCNIFYMLVSTLDGRVSALDLHKNGALVWSVQADARPLYSSSLASMEMIHNGRKMRLIPSLDGALYQFDGEKVEAVPLSAESLLSSTHRLSDDSMIVGSKDMRSFGVNLHTGEIYFTCGSEGCNNSQGKSRDKLLEGSNFLILTRSTQVVRSVDIKNGIEKWNFTVGQHQIRLSPTSRPSETDDIDDEEYNLPIFKTASADECSSEKRHINITDYENRLQVIVPEGRIVALNKRNSDQVSWEHKFDTPIAKAWFLHHDKLEAVSLFDGHHIPSLNIYFPEDTENEIVPQPLLYIGSHQNLLYIQVSPQFESVLKTFTTNRIGHIIDPNLKVSWRPYLNTASVRTPIFGGNRPQITNVRRSSDLKSRKESTSLTVWHEDYPFDTGYFLYPEFCDTRSPRRRDVMLIEDFTSLSERDKNWLQLTPSLYRKEVMFIFVIVSIGVHILLTRFFNSSHCLTTESLDACQTSDISKTSDSSHEVMMTSDSTSILGDRMSTSEEYVSRFATDFDCLHRLGKGGFGVIFEAVNKVDDQHYAVKRIMLPKSDGAKEKVLREVKALAKLDHTGIVRYFNAWVESPPTGWQEERDEQFHFSDTSGPTSHTETASHIGGYHSEQSQFVPSAETREERNRNNKDVQDKCPLTPVTRMGSEIATDSITFSSQNTPCVQMSKQSGSGNFSVHSSLSETFDRCENGFAIPRDSFFSFGVNANTMDVTSDSITDSKSSIPFSNYSFSSSALISHPADQSDQELSGDSVVFESTNNRPTCNNAVYEQTTSFCNSDVVFEKSSVSEGKQMNENGHCYCQNDQEHHMVDFSLSLHKNDSKGERAENKSSAQVVLCGNKFFLYIQMQLYRKETLKDWLNSNTLNRDRHTVLDIFDQILCAVDYVHSQGLMHRDLKPSNIFFTADEVVKVGDFGLVTALSVQQDQESDSGLKSPGKHTAEVGTTLYMSPEQIARRPYDLKIDIFSLGLIFLELLIPFSTQMERIRTLQDAKKQIFPLRFNRELPLESELVHKMTNSDPNLRPFTMDILDHPLLLEFAPTRMGTGHRKRTISNKSIS